MHKRILSAGLICLLFVIIWSAKAATCADYPCGGGIQTSLCSEDACLNLGKNVDGGCWWQSFPTGGSCSECKGGITSCSGYGTDNSRENACTNNHCKVNLPNGCEFGASGCADASGTSTDQCTTITKCEDYDKDQCTTNPCKIKADCELSGTACKTIAGSGGADSGADEDTQFIDEIKQGLYQVVMLLYCLVLYIAAAVAALTIVLTGIKYMSSEDGGGRAESRRQLTYALLGLLIIAMACPLVNVFFTDGKIGIPDANGKKVPCPTCPLIPDLGSSGPVVNPPTHTPIGAQSGDEVQCAKACADAGKGYTAGKCLDACASPDVPLSYFTCLVTGKSKCCCTPPASGVGYSSCDAACKAQKDVSGAAKYTGGSCAVSCSGAGSETYSGFDCTKEGKPAGNVCCCALEPVTVAPHSLGANAKCQHSIECIDGYYCGGGFPQWNCIPNAGENVNCNPDQEVEGKFRLICQTGFACQTKTIEGAEFHSCQKPRNAQSCEGSGGHCCDMSIAGTTCDTEITLTKDQWVEPECAGNNVKCCTVCRA